jgi:non-specific serine/threonine protein kinase
LPLTSYVGREREIEVATRLVRGEGIRLVTLTGPGGVGKTRLAIRVAEEMVGDHPGGVWFVPLAAVQDPSLVVSTVARVLAVPEAVGQSLEASIRAFLVGRRALVIFDNFEHVLDAAPMVADLLGACPHLKALVTSRAVLRVSGEHEVPVPPLSLPSRGVEESRSREEAPVLLDSSTARLLDSSEAVELFVARARATRPDFALTDDNAGVVRAICERLDGLPLAIELAAARIGHLPLLALLTRLEKRLPVLTGGRQDQPRRHRTMRDAVAWSHDLLDHDERCLFERLSVFAGGFTLEAAEAVARGPAPSSPSFLDRVASLVDRSLLHREPAPDDQARFGMLETVREYGLERLAANGEEAAIRRAHAAYYSALAESSDLWGPAGQGWLTRLETEHHNLRAALDWHLVCGDADGAQRLAGSLWQYWYMCGRFAEGRRWLERALALGDDARLASRASALTGAGALAAQQGDLDQAETLLAAGATLYRRLGDHLSLGVALGCHGNVMMSKGDLAQAQALYEEELARYREAGHAAATGNALLNLGRVAAARGDYERAERLLAQSHAQMQVSGGVWDRGVSLYFLGCTARLRGARARAHARYQEALALFRESGDPARVAWCLEGLAGVAGSEEAIRSARLLGAAEVLREQVGQPMAVGDRPTYQGVVAAARDALGGAAFATAWAAGRALEMDGAIAEALALEPPAAVVGVGEDPTTALGLTRRQREVFTLLADGRSDREIASILFISPKTVGLHVSNVLGKLGVPSRAAAVAFAHRRGLVATASVDAAAPALKDLP